MTNYHTQRFAIYRYESIKPISKYFFVFTSYIFKEYLRNLIESSTKVGKAENEKKKSRKDNSVDKVCGTWNLKKI